MKQIKVVFLLALIVSLVNCKDHQSFNNQVKHHGALMNLMSGNLESTASLDSLQSLPHLYALGALENLKGEVQIFDSESKVSKSGENNSVLIEPHFNHKASLLVYAQVPEWQEMMKLDSFASNSMLEQHIKTAAVEQGIDVSQPFPFLLKGTAATLDWHVINWPEGDTVHTHKKHQESGSFGTLEKEEVEIIGFYSEQHKAVFTHHTTFLHMHFQSFNGLAIAGHLDAVTGKELTLFLPKK